MIKEMNWENLSQHLSKMQTNEIVEFACTAMNDWPTTMPTEEECTNWYFAKVIKVPEYGSRFLLIDAFEGEEAFAIPVNSYGNYFEQDVIDYIPLYVKTFFKQCKNLGSVKDYVFVDVK